MWEVTVVYIKTQILYTNLYAIWTEDTCWASSQCFQPHLSLTCIDFKLCLFCNITKTKKYVVRSILLPNDKSAFSEVTYLPLFLCSFFVMCNKLSQTTVTITTLQTSHLSIPVPQEYLILIYTSDVITHFSHIWNSISNIKLDALKGDSFSGINSAKA
jgi:hypothetical protein